MPHNIMFRKTSGNRKSRCCYGMALATLMPLFSNGSWADFIGVISDKLSSPSRVLFGFVLTCPNPNTNSGCR
jgi:hypothetical protein